MISEGGNTPFLVQTQSMKQTQSFALPPLLRNSNSKKKTKSAQTSSSSSRLDSILHVESILAYGVRPLGAAVRVPFATVLFDHALSAAAVEALRADVDDALAAGWMEDFSADAPVAGHRYMEGLWHALAEGGPQAALCPRRDVLVEKRQAPPRVVALVAAVRRGNAEPLRRLAGRLRAAGLSAAAAEHLRARAFCDVACQLHAGAPVPRELAARRFRHTDTVMSLLHLGVTLAGSRGVAFETYDVPDAPARAAPVLRLSAPRVGSAYLASPVFVYHYPYYPCHAALDEEPVLALQLRILNADDPGLAELYRGGSYRGGLSPLAGPVADAIRASLLDDGWNVAIDVHDLLAT
jgi:hypothetical protein